MIHTAFAGDYFEARANFLLAAARAGLHVESIWHPTAQAPNGAPLAVDVARAGKLDASHILFTVCGTHGVEGYPGSAAQIALLDSGALSSLPDHIGVVFLHGLNPYGWSRDSQRNEDGIDINRNFIDFNNAPEPDVELVQRFAALLDIKSMTFANLGRAVEALFAIRDEVGGARFMQALGAGQYVEPKGLKYGGDKPSWSNLVYRDIVRRYLSKATHIAEVDWHTGLGPYGGVFPLCMSPIASEAFDVTCAWWGRAAVERGAKSWSEDDDDAPAPDYFGLTHMGLVEEAPRAKVAGGAIEFGTIPVTEIPQVVFLDHWLLHNAPKDIDTRYWRAQMRTFMAPRDPKWERSVRAHAERIYANTLKGLATWDV